MNRRPSHVASRRAFLQAGGCAVLGTAWSRQTLSAAEPTELPLIAKSVPVGGERIPAIGLGTDAFQVSERDAIQAEIQRMVMMGGRVIDTAAAYGDSEQLIGEALSTLKIRDQVFLATKFSEHGQMGQMGNSASGEASLLRSLERLQTQRLDLLQIHNLDGVDHLMPMLQAWKKAGRIRYVGVTTSRVSQHAELLEVMRKHPLDFIQVDYSLEDRDAAAQVFPEALQRRVAVLVNLPFARASLLGQAGQHPLPDWAASFDAASWGQFFLKYVISHPAVTCAIPGSTKLAHLQDNQLAARGRLPDQAMRTRMEQFWDAGI